MHTPQPTVSVNNEWGRLRMVLVGRAGKACFPPERPSFIEATMPQEYHPRFKPNSPFPANIVAAAEQELDQLALILESEGVHVIRSSKDIDWEQLGGYTGAMPRDGLLTIRNVIIESCFAWDCRRTEVETAYGEMLKSLEEDKSVVVLRRPKSSLASILHENPTPNQEWAINNKRPALEAADFLRFGDTIVGQYSHVTNEAGVTYLRASVPHGVSVEMLDVVDPCAMHIDATITPISDGLLVYNPKKVTEESLRKLNVLRGWRLVPWQGEPKAPEWPPLFMTSPWLCLNTLVIAPGKIMVEESDTTARRFYESLGVTCIPCPFRNVQSIGGSFHCATVDLAREI